MAKKAIVNTGAKAEPQVSRNTCRMTGMILMIISIFPIMAGLYLPAAGIDKPITVGSIIVGLLLFVAGIVFYKILQND